ncbi:MAG: hypothetical protein DKT66_16165 [Candidatus Melainabacteria bacterium]|nr:MAG: hypothetical protein DKT66_16165 [Candidatus Melainabacteria bacterium]
MNWKLIILALYMMHFMSVPADACNENTKLQIKSACQKQSVSKRLLASRIFVPTQNGQIGSNKTRIAKLAACRNNTSSPWKLLGSLYSDECVARPPVRFYGGRSARKPNLSKSSTSRKDEGKAGFQSSKGSYNVPLHSPWRKLSELFSY